MLILAVMTFSVITGLFFALGTEWIRIRRDKLREEKVQKEVDEITRQWHEF